MIDRKITNVPRLKITAVEHHLNGMMQHHGLPYASRSHQHHGPAHRLPHQRVKQIEIRPPLHEPRTIANLVFALPPWILATNPLNNVFRQYALHSTDNNTLQI